MGRLSHGVYVGLCIALIAGLGAGVGAGCQPLYGGKPEKLSTLTKKKPPAEQPVEVAKVPEIEDCQADFRGDPKTVRAQTALSNQLTGEGDTALANSARAADPMAQAGLIKDSIDKYRNALLKDPYNAEATLKLALAYDKVYRKGCAIAMLKRLAALSANPKYAKAATPAIDSIGDNGQWFKRYRKDAITAVGR
jgi:thioredoxin-like negative regulator of GroEL